MNGLQGQPVIGGQLSWDQLRREARKIENELDTKLAAFGKQCSRYEYGSTGESGMSVATNLTLTSNDIESLIEQLRNINEQIATLSQEGTETRNHHILARHRDILHDFTEEYKRLNSIALSERNRVDLLGSSQGFGTSQPTSTQGILLRERGTLDRSHSEIDTVVAQAYGVASSLGQQRQMFDGIDARLALIGAKFPVMNSVMNAIRRKKNRDTLILTGVGSVLFLCMLLYWMNK